MNERSPIPLIHNATQQATLKCKVLAIKTISVISYYNGWEGKWIAYHTIAIDTSTILTKFE